MRWEPSSEKKFRIQLFVLSLIMGILVIGGSLLYINYQKKLTSQRSQQTISAISALKVDQLVQWNTERLSEVRFFSTSQPVVRFALPVIAGDKSKEPQLRKALQHILSDNRYDDIALYDTKGTLLFSVTQKAHPIDSINKVLLDSVVRTQTIVFRDFYTCTYENKVRANYLAPIQDNNSRVVAGLLFIIDPYDFYYQHIKSWPVPSPTAHSILVTKHPDAIEFLSPIPGCDTMDIPCRKELKNLDYLSRAIISGNDGFLEGKDVFGVKVLAYVQHVQGTDWTLISKISKKEVFADYYRIVGLAILFSITLLLLLFGGIVWLYKKRQQRMYEELYKKSVDLYHSQEEFGATLYSIAEGVIATDEKGNVSRMNAVASMMTGWKEFEATGKPIEAVFITHDVETRLLCENPVRLLLQQNVKAEVGNRYISMLVSRNGTEAYISESCALIKGPEGTVIGAVLVFSDQTEEQVRKHILLESEEKYRSLVNQMQLGLALHEIILENGKPVDYRFLEVNPGFEQLTGHTRDQLIGKTVLEVMPGTESYWIEKYSEVVMSGKAVTLENYSATLGKHYSVIAYPVGSMKFATIVEDVTERKQMLDALRSNEQSYRELIDNVSDTVWIIDVNGNLIDVNKEVTNKLGYTKEEVLRIGLKGIDVKINDEEVEKLNIIILEGTEMMFETIHRAKNGRLIPVEVNAARVNYMGKQVSVCIARDITQRKRAEGFQQLLYEIASFTSGSGTFDELLSLIRTELGHVMDATNFYVALHNPSTNSLDEMLFVNEMFSTHSWSVEGTLSGYVLKTEKSLLLCGNDRQAFLKQHAIDEVENPPACWMGVPLFDAEASMGVLVIQHYTDPNAYDNSNLQILETVAHELSVVIQRQHMINDLIGAKEKAEESDRLKTAFLANVSHEIRTPMNGILGFIEMLNDPGLDPASRAEFVDIVTKSGQRLLATIEEIIEVSRIEAGLVELHEMETDLTETMFDQYSFHKTTAQEKGLEFELREHVTGHEALVDTDKFKLDAILSNILNNAFKFTRSGSIVFGNSIQGDEVLFYVRDTGMGIPKDRQEAIFHRFVQADLTTTRPYEGSGLGLSIVKAYLEKMGGRIWVDSEPDKGSTFYFTLPYKPIDPPVIEQMETPHADLDGSSVSILVAEDDPINYIYLETLLLREGIVVYHASNGNEAVDLFKEHPDVDAILMDIKMPFKNGLDATREIRELDKHVPIIAQTAYAFAEDKEKTQEAGCTSFLTKPTSREQLLQSLHTHVPRLKKVD